MDKNSEIAAKPPAPTPKGIPSLQQKTKPRKPHYEMEEASEPSSPVRGSINRDPRME